MSASAAAIPTAAAPADERLTSDLVAWRDRGDRAALERACLALLPVGAAVARRHLAAADADDAVQTAFVRLLGAMPRWQADGRDPRAWFAVAVLNECRTLRRRERRFEARQRASAVRVSPPAEAGDGLGDLLQALPDEQRTVITLHILAGIGIRQVAAAIGRNERTVRTWIAAGLGRLRTRYGAAVLAAFLATPLPAVDAAGHIVVQEIVRTAAWRRPPLIGIRTGIILAVAAVLMVALGVAGWLAMGASTASGPATPAGPIVTRAMPAPLDAAEMVTRAAPATGAAPVAAAAVPVDGEGTVPGPGPALRWIVRRPPGSDRLLVILGHNGCDLGTARQLRDALGRTSLARGWSVAVAWRPDDHDGAYPRAADVPRLLEALTANGAGQATRTVLMGCSLGGDSALDAALSGQVTVAGVIGWPGRPPAQVRTPVPVLLGMAEDDELGWSPAMRSGAARLRDLGVPVSVRSAPGPSHLPDLPETVIADWIDRRAPENPGQPQRPPR